LELHLREKAIRKFAILPSFHTLKLFFNVDTRVLEMPNYRPGNTVKILERYGLPPERIVFEISEMHRLISLDTVRKILEQYRSQGFQVAIDDYGTGFAGLQALYLCEPQYIKIPRFFIEGIVHDHRKRLFLSNVTAMSHTLGILVIGEGVETEEEFYACAEIGCDGVQGFLLGKPDVTVHHIVSLYPIVEVLHEKNRRKNPKTQKLIENHLEAIPPVSVHEPLETVCRVFRQSPQRTFIPVVGVHQEPLGVIWEYHLRNILYAPYGRDLLSNPSLHNTEKFLLRCPIFDIETPIDMLLSAFSLLDEVPCVLFTHEGKYLGLLDPQGLLKVIYEQRIRGFRDANPLTQLPGNQSIYEYLHQSLREEDTPFAYVYFDIDYFKSFNDRYGFRQGDRIILLLADLLKKTFLGQCFFLGHVGGDDFFLGVRLEPPAFSLGTLWHHVQEVLLSFSHHAASFYAPEDLERGYLIEKDRFGKTRKMPLLSATAVMVYRPPQVSSLTIDTLSEVVARLKKRAKTEGIRSLICIQEEKLACVSS